MSSSDDEESSSSDPRSGQPSDSRSGHPHYDTGGDTLNQNGRSVRRSARIAANQRKDKTASESKASNQANALPDVNENVPLKKKRTRKNAKNPKITTPIRNDASAEAADETKLDEDATAGATLDDDGDLDLTGITPVGDDGASADVDESDPDMEAPSPHSPDDALRNAAARAAQSQSSSGANPELAQQATLRELTAKRGKRRVASKAGASTGTTKGPKTDAPKGAKTGAAAKAAKPKKPKLQRASAIMTYVPPPSPPSDKHNKRRSSTYRKRAKKKKVTVLTGKGRVKQRGASAAKRKHRSHKNSNKVASPLLGRRKGSAVDVNDGAPNPKNAKNGDDGNAKPPATPSNNQSPKPSRDTAGKHEDDAKPSPELKTPHEPSESFRTPHRVDKDDEAADDEESDDSISPRTKAEDDDQTPVTHAKYIAVELARVPTFRVKEHPHLPEPGSYDYYSHLPLPGTDFQRWMVTTNDYGGLAMPRYCPDNLYTWPYATHPDGPSQQDAVIDMARDRCGSATPTRPSPSTSASPTSPASRCTTRRGWCSSSPPTARWRTTCSSCIRCRWPSCSSSSSLASPAARSRSRSICSISRLSSSEMPGLTACSPSMRAAHSTTSTCGTPIRRPHQWSTCASSAR